MRRLEVDAPDRLGNDTSTGGLGNRPRRLDRRNFPGFLHLGHSLFGSQPSESIGCVPYHTGPVDFADHSMARVARQEFFVQLRRYPAGIDPSARQSLKHGKMRLRPQHVEASHGSGPPQEQRERISVGLPGLDLGGDRG